MGANANRLNNELQFPIHFFPFKSVFNNMKQFDKKKNRNLNFYK